MAMIRPLRSGKAATFCFTLACFACVPWANAQDAPLIDAVGAYNHANVMTRPGTEGSTTKQDNPQHLGNAMPTEGTISRERFDAIVAGLRVEYRRRTDRDGKAAADAWLRDTVGELRKRYTTVVD